MSQLISVVIITYNEEKNIVQCIESIESIASEIVVVDAFSTDQTVELARKTGAKVTLRAWQGYGSARNYGASIASHDWIFSIDADERAQVSLVKNIIEERLMPSTVYKVKRHNIYCSRIIQYGFLRPEWKPRLYHRSKSQWDQRIVHEQLNTQEHSSSYKKIQGILLHEAYSSEEEYRSKLSKYAKLTAQGWHEDGEKPFVILPYLGPTYHFLRSYLLHLGVLEGRIGWQTSKGAYFYSKEKYQAFSRKSVTAKS